MIRSLLAMSLVFFLLGAGGCAEFLGVGDESQSSVGAPSELYNRAFEQYEAGHYAQAKELFHQFIGQYPDSQLYKVSLYYLGHCDQMLGDLKEAEVFYSRLIDTYGDEDFWGAQAMKRLKQIKEIK